MLSIHPFQYFRYIKPIIVLCNYICVFIYIYIYIYKHTLSTSLVAQMVMNLPLEMELQFLDWEDSLDKGMATHSSILAWRIPWMEKPDGLQSTGSQRVGHN